MSNKRIITAILTGGILGVFCITGIIIRLGYCGNELFILSTWINRVIMGLLIGLAPYYKIKNNKTNIILRGAFLGFIMSGSFYLATAFRDTTGFVAGIFYGIIIDWIATKNKK